MIIFLTGSTGLAGAAIAEAAARRGHQVIGIGFRTDLKPPGVSSFLQLDLSDETILTRSLLDIFPDVIINAAAISEPAKCDEDPAGSSRVNVHLPSALARLAHHVSARLIHLSTDMVFDGRASHYSPDSPTSPTSEYGRQKLVAEKNILQQAPELAIVLRTTLLTGNSLRGRRSAHEKLFENWAAGKPTPLFADELRQPCLANNLAEAVVEIAERNDVLGTFHWAGAETISRYEIGRQILEHFKLPTELVQKTSLADDPRFANRPANLTLDTHLLTGKLKTRPLDFETQLDQLKVPPPFRDWYNSL